MWTDVRDRQSFIAKRRNELKRKATPSERIVGDVLKSLERRYSHYHMKVIAQSSRWVKGYGLFYWDFVVYIRVPYVTRKTFFIEVDGGYHNTASQRARDQHKEQAVLNKKSGKRAVIIRIKNAECFNLPLLSQKLSALVVQ